MSKSSARWAGALLTTAAAAWAAGAVAGPVHPGQESGLGLIPGHIPKVLQEARAAPYDLPPSRDCGTLGAQIAELDRALGPDLDDSRRKSGNRIDIMDGLRSMIPYGGIVRVVTGADKRDHELIEDALAGYERRGFLKGMVRNMNCAPGEETAQAAAVEGTSAAALAPAPPTYAQPAYGAPAPPPGYYAPAPPPPAPQDPGR